jgi:regulator of sigma E protease
MTVTILSFLFVLGVCIFVHELGHFLMAKSVGIRVERFSLGFPPKMVGKKIGHTEYMISWIPLGGYVKMAGENLEEEKSKWEPYEFMSKSVSQRALVIMAGPAMNFILAALIFWGIFLFMGKQIIHDDRTEIGFVTEESPAQKAGIEVGDVILSINGKEVTDFRGMAEVIYEQVEKPILVEWKRGEERLRATIVTQKEQVINQAGETQTVGKIGIGPTYSVVRLNIFESLWEGIGTAVLILLEVIKFIIALVSGKVSLKLVGGPVFIAQTAGETARMGLVSLFSFIALISVNLALVNALPIPILDGGHILFLTIEKIQGKPLSLKQRSVLQQIGFAFLLVLIILITYNDFSRLIG